LTRVQFDRLELELKSRDQNIAKLRAHLNMAKTNKEYSAILTELNTSKADTSKIESQVLELMKNIEADEAVCAELEKQIEEQKGRLEAVRKDADAKSGHLEVEVETIQAEWDAAAKDVPHDALEVFKRVADTYDGEGVVIAGKQNEKVDIYSCGGCFMGLPAEIVNRLMTKDEIIRCSNCTRILTLQEDHD